MGLLTLFSTHLLWFIDKVPSVDQNKVTRFFGILARLSKLTSQPFRSCICLGVFVLVVFALVFVFVLVYFSNRPSLYCYALVYPTTLPWSLTFRLGFQLCHRPATSWTSACCRYSAVPFLHCKFWSYCFLKFHWRARSLEGSWSCWSHPKLD